MPNSKKKEAKNSNADKLFKQIKKGEGSPFKEIARIFDGLGVKASKKSEDK